jgi:acyl-CoA thioesterase
VKEIASGLESLKLLVGKPLSGPFSKFMGFYLDSASDGQVKVSATPEQQHLNIMDRLHGGFCAALIDTTMGVAVVSAMPAFVPFGTVQLNLHFVRKIDLESGQLVCTAQLIHRGRTMMTVEATVSDARGKLCAHGTGTFLVYPEKNS